MQVAALVSGGDRFAGDFVVPEVTPDQRYLDVVLVDVAGRGSAAGTRALLLAGAVSGILGVAPPERVLPGIHRYVVRQQWDEGFVTAAYVHVDLLDGHYVLFQAGHPPAAQRHAGDGRWQLIDTVGGPLLGVYEAEWPAHRGRLRVDDVLLLYTDGLVERPGIDLSRGIDRLLGRAEPLVVRTPDDAAQQLVTLNKGVDDDQTAVLLIRTGQNGTQPGADERPDLGGLPELLTRKGRARRRRR